MTESAILIKGKPKLVWRAKICNTTANAEMKHFKYFMFIFNFQYSSPVLSWNYFLADSPNWNLTFELFLSVLKAKFSIMGVSVIKRWEFQRFLGLPPASSEKKTEKKGQSIYWNEECTTSYILILFNIQTINVANKVAHYIHTLRFISCTNPKKHDLKSFKMLKCFIIYK